MRNSFLWMLIAFGSAVAMPAMAAQKIERYAFQHPHSQRQQMHHQQTQKNTAKGVTTGSTAGTIKPKSRSID